MALERPIFSSQQSHISVSPYLWFVVSPRIEHQHTSRRKVFGVPGHDVQAVATRCSSNETVTCGNDPSGFLRGGREFSPGVAFFQKNNCFGDLSDGYDTDKQTVVFERFDRTADTRTPFRVAQFGEHAGIEKDSHNFTSRMGASSRVTSSSSKFGPSPMRNSSKPGRLPVSFS
jgi:hypothetical protein